MERSNEAVEGRSAGFSGKLARRTRSGARVWSPQIKGRAVFESMRPGARVCEVAERYGVKAQQLTTWRRSARKGELALVADEAPDFVAIEVSEPVVPRKPAPIVISIGRVSVRLDAEVPSARIVEIATALDRST